MLKNIAYSPDAIDPCISLGRNGCIKTVGLQLLGIDHSRRLLMMPISSRHTTGKCQIEIPAGALTPLINALREWRQDCRRKRVG